MTDQTENIQTEDDDFDFYDDSTPFTADNLKRENERLAAEVAAENREEEEELRKATNPDGTFKSLAHRMRYADQEFPQWLPNAPHPAQYSADQEEQFWTDYNSFVATGRLSNSLDPLPDYEHRAERDKLTREIAEHRRTAEIALRNGKMEAVEIHNNLARHCENDLDKLPKPERQLRAEEESFKSDELTADQLFDPENLDNPAWESERLQHDSAVFLAEHNQRAKKFIRLPVESAPFGNPQPCKPSNMIKFDLPEKVVTKFKREVYNVGGADDPDTVFRRSWAWLHRNGYAANGTLAVKPKKAKASKKEEPSGYHDGMTMAGFEAWRKKTAGPKGLRRF
jgi:hypothetical protein